MTIATGSQSRRSTRLRVAAFMAALSAETTTGTQTSQGNAAV